MAFFTPDTMSSHSERLESYSRSNGSFGKNSGMGRSARSSRCRTLPGPRTAHRRRGALRPVQ
ncbi:MAG: hypothetical protein ACRECR_01120 [Thermoplasmata archaeon]